MTRLAAFLACAVLFGAHAAPADIAGTKPAYLEAATTSIPNEGAIVRRVWTPGVEEGFIPQGLTVAAGHVLVAMYRATEPKQNTGPCRVYRVEIASGAVTGSFDLPPALCGHAGGLAYLGNGQLLLADTKQLLRIDLERAFSTGKAEQAMRGTLKLGGALRGSFAAFDGKDPWIGTWTKEINDARMYRFSAELFDERDGQVIREDVALESIPIPVEVQGAGFAKDGKLWLSASNSRWGKLYCVDRQGKVEAQFPMVAGVEDIDFDVDGGLWAVSESGTRKYLQWETRFPFLFRLDVGKLR
jgi:hypothetical protein